MGVGNMAQLLQYLLYKHENLKFHPQQSHKKAEHSLKLL